MKYCCIVIILASVYFISGVFDDINGPWYYGVAALWSTLIVFGVALCEVSFPSSNIYSTYLSLYIIFLESSAVFIDFLVILGGLDPSAVFYWHFDSMMSTITVLELVGILLWLLWMLWCGIYYGLFAYNTPRHFRANIYRNIINKNLFRH